MVAAAGFAMVRYADDFVILCRSQEEAERALAWVRGQVEAKGLTLHPKKTDLSMRHKRGGLIFSGITFGGAALPRKKSLDKLKERIRLRRRGTAEQLAVHREAQPGPAWLVWILQIQPQDDLRRIDGWVRSRLRSILRTRAGRKGRGRGADHHRWKNAFFAEQGLFGLATPMFWSVGSRRRTH